MRRFITLIDALYDNKVLLLILADSEPMKLLEIDEDQKKTSSHDEVMFIFFCFIRFLINVLI
jgi:predicted ATPase